MNIVSSKCKQTAHPQNGLHSIFKGQEYIAALTKLAPQYF